MQSFRTKASSQIFPSGPPSVFSYLDDFAMEPLYALDAGSPALIQLVIVKTGSKCLVIFFLAYILS
jgi:hypothetical protein